MLKHKIVHLEYMRLTACHLRLNKVVLKRREMGSEVQCNPACTINTLKQCPRRKLGRSESGTLFRVYISPWLGEGVEEGAMPSANQLSQ